MRPGDVVLGNPVGENQFCEQECSAFAHRAAATLRAIEALQLSCRTKVQMMRFCINPRVQYMTRVHEQTDLFRRLYRLRVVTCLRPRPDSCGSARAAWSGVGSFTLSPSPPRRPRNHAPLLVAGNFGKASSLLLIVQFLDAHVTNEEAWMHELRNSFAAQDFHRGLSSGTRAQRSGVSSCVSSRDCYLVCVFVCAWSLE